MSEVRLLQVSDLHFGAHDESKVEAVLADCKEFAPHIVCVTGDVVNSPFWPGNFSEARRFIDALAERLAASSGPDNVLIVPGNHDAYLGVWAFRLGLKRSDTDFFRAFEVEGRNVLVFGFDSTSSALRDFQNSGIVSERQIKAFLEQVGCQRERLGPAGFANSLKVVLLHHHPLPTMKSNLEGMLYLKNAGRFMSAMVGAKVDLILHGHQHDPCDATITYGGGLERVLVLSAGTATKRRDDETPLSDQTQYHRIVCSRDEIQVEGRHYQPASRTFQPGKALRNVVGGGTYALRRREVRYTICSGGDLREWTKEILRCKAGRTANTHRVYFGVDEESRECTSFVDLDFTIRHNGKELERDQHWTVTVDEAREKVVDVTCEELVGCDDEVEIDWSYTWPGGWAKLDRYLEDEASYLPNGLDELRVIVKNDHPSLRIASIDVVTTTGNDITRIENIVDQEVGFVARSPRSGHYINSIIRVARRRGARGLDRSSR